MLRRSTKIQLVLFVVITMLGVSYVGANYVGLFRGFLSGSQCSAYADFPDSGGIFSNAEVTYRGVAIGRVGSLHAAQERRAGAAQHRQLQRLEGAGRHRGGRLGPVGDRRAVRQPHPAG